MRAQSDDFGRFQLEGFELLEALALNLRWSWNHSTDQLWQQMDAELWEETQNPWIVLQNVSIEKLSKLLADKKFKATVEELVQLNHSEMSCPAWYQQTYPNSPLTAVAYFSMEYMLTEALPIYSGGLGNVAGDQLKAASDLGVPVYAVGLLYSQGYFRQVIDREGAQEAFYPYNDPGQLPLMPLRSENGEWLRLEIKLPGYSMWLRTWHVRVGRVNLYLLDSNDMANYPAHRGITTELYGGGEELRLQQEILLGIGGWRLLEALGVQPEVCHLNEGHAALAILERAHSYMLRNNVSFEIAFAATRVGNLFTTHTAVPAGFDRFSDHLLRLHLENYIACKIGISFERFLSLGKVNPTDSNERFNMAYLALRGSGAVNGVSQLHAEVSKELFAPIFPRWPKSEIPIGHVTNGIHVPSWDSTPSDNLWSSACGKDRWLNCTEGLEAKMHALPEESIWEMRQKARERLVDIVRVRQAKQLTLIGASKAEIEEAKQIFDGSILTMGFARRFATYKRPNLLLSDPERLLRILNHPKWPVQLILAGKAHPADFAGKALIQEWNRFIKRKEAAANVVFLSDYDMLLTEQLVQGVDVWINTPRRPWEACGTSGMKILANGGLNLSELDGWWAETYTPEVGWALGSQRPNVTLSDVEEANNLYELLENQVIPEFYTRGPKNIPSRWVCRIRESMARLTGRFSTNRSVREYVETYYLPAAESYKARSQNDSKIAKTCYNQSSNLEVNWQTLSFGELRVKQIGDKYEFHIPLQHKGIEQAQLSVQLFAEGQRNPVPMQPSPLSEKSPEFYTIYTATAPATRPATDYTPRVIPNPSPLLVPLEDSHILWAS